MTKVFEEGLFIGHDVCFDLIEAKYAEATHAGSITMEAVQTNPGGLIALCRCGWIGNQKPSIYEARRDFARHEAELIKDEKNKLR